MAASVLTGSTHSRGGGAAEKAEGSDTSDSKDGNSDWGGNEERGWQRRKDWKMIHRSATRKRTLIGGSLGTTTFRQHVTGVSSFESCFFL